MEYNGINFDDYTKNDDGTLWAQICNTCVVNYQVENKLLDDSGSGICGVLGCENEADYYIDFPSEEVKNDD